ncbi:hypothetical protein [Nocardiopsis deserti]|uniref:hypothetical protein n=1 Tax=Nocardiopsis deserti TaxID=2605988 RepID=UPI001CC220C6|nr:hypothetical protein [Nocardiopsis deserti]
MVTLNYRLGSEGFGRVPAYVVGLWRGTDTAVCNHVRRVVAPVLSGADEAARHDVTLAAAALVEAEGRAVRGAAVDHLTAYTVQRAQDWQPF